MDYTLAKQLKDAGFPQEGNGQLVSVADVRNHISGMFYEPTLSELVEACPKTYCLSGTLALLWGSGKWWAGYITASGSVSNMKGEGKTLSIAVAKLWLKLKEIKWEYTQQENLVW